MKINKFIKLKDCNYKIQFSNNEELKVHEDLILKYELLLKKELEDNLKEKIIDEQKIYDIYNIALKYIKIRIRSSKELESYLLKKGYNTNEVDKTLNILKKQGYLSDDIYTKSLIHDRINLSNNGPLKIKIELEKNNINKELIAKYLETFTEELEIERIKKIINKHLKINKNCSSYMLKKKIEINLINLGYHQYLINELLNSIKLSDKDAYKIEYDKQYKKLSRKYTGKELEYKIKEKLYQKGFKNSYE